MIMSNVEISMGGKILGGGRGGKLSRAKSVVGTVG